MSTQSTVPDRDAFRRSPTRDTQSRGIDLADSWLYVALAGIVLGFWIWGGSGFFARRTSATSCLTRR